MGEVIESDGFCLRCGLRLSMTHEFCFASHDGNHRPTLPTQPAANQEPGA